MKQAVKVELDRLKTESGGLLTVNVVLGAARDRNSPLHDEFTWDKTAALKRNLENEARALIRTYLVVITTPVGPIKHRQFVSLVSDRVQGGGYRVMSEVLSDEALSSQLMQDALMELESFTARYQRVQQLAGVFREIEAVRERYQQQQPRRRRRSGESRPAA